MFQENNISILLSMLANDNAYLWYAILKSVSISNSLFHGISAFGSYLKSKSSL